MLKKFLSAAALAVTVSAGTLAADYGLPANIQEGNILHCFDWTCAQVESELDNIAEAGFGAVQLSPVQGNCNVGAEWFYAYMPYDFALKGSGVGNKSQLTALCSAAHQRGIKVIVDVVANHVNQASGYHDTWWDSNGRVRWNGGINYGNRYSITHNQLGDYGDVNSEDSQVQARAKAFVEELKACGVDGIRWDAAKHIGLPSEGCNFWSTVTSVPGMWHYGEILDSPGGDGNAVMKEYTKYMSVTDNGYCDGVRKAVNGGGAPTGYAGWAASTISDTKVVYWAESHDDYSNEWQASTHISQAVIDRTWAIVACRNGASSLYFSRPFANTRNTIKMGVKGSTHFTSPEIAAINRLRNTAVGHPDYFSSSNGVVSVTRKDVGAAIIKGNGQAGNVSVTNGGGYCPAGSYKDLVSGGTFTVTATTISGNVGSTGIAVLIKDGALPDPDPDPNPNPDPDPDPEPDGTHYVYFDGTSFSQPQVWAWNDTENCTVAGVWGGDNMVKKNNLWYWEVPAGKSLPTMIIIHEGDNKIGGGDLKYVDKATYHQDGTYTVGDNPNPNPDPDPDPDPQPASMFVLGNLEGAAGWSATPGTGLGMTQSGQTFTANKVKFVAAAGETECYFNITDYVGSTWNDLNMNANRYGAAVEGEPIILGTPATVVAYPKNVTASGCLSWTIAPGMYDIVFDKAGMKLTVKKSSSGIDDIDMSETRLPVEYYNLQGVRVAEPTPGIYIMRQGNKVSKVRIP